MKERFIILLAAFLLDLLLGDPPYPFHPVRLMGKVIIMSEKGVRFFFQIPVGQGNEKGTLKKIRSLSAGGFLVILVLLICAGLPAIMFLYIKQRFRFFSFILSLAWVYQLLSARDMKDEAMKVYDSLEKEDLPKARQCLSRIVGRDTDSLDRKGIIMATIETVAENTSDGVIAPMLFYYLFDIPGIFFYKASNTMDSMLGYKNEKYRYFGRAAARLDDLCNFIPSRLTAFLFILSAFLTGFDWKEAWRIMWRDAGKHNSPNAGWPESAVAGALGLRLGGPASYFGKISDKAWLGDRKREYLNESIPCCCRLMYVSSLLFFILPVFGFVIHCFRQALPA